MLNERVVFFNTFYYSLCENQNALTPVKRRFRRPGEAHAA